MSVSMELMMNGGPTTKDFPRFGECSFSEADVISFPWGLPGFPNLRRWLALTVESQNSFVWLQSVDDVKIALPTADPYSVFGDYNPKLPAYAATALDIAEASDFTVLCVMVVTEDADEMTMNLFAPIVVNLRSRTARQVVLENSGFSVRQPVPRKAGAEA
ncbi:MAG: flagellar assembly protein FliW [Candidatus Eremiobacteraeota bacterium]|nr:flagellar assembly protein FliW [Candidatus Eremiobacteraeota bacterium]